jgi:hypothetical protein
MNVQTAINTLQSYLKFKDNWDQQGAKAPSPVSIHTTITFLLERLDEPYLVGLNRKGHAFVEYLKNQLDSESFSFDENGKITYLLIDRKYCINF